MICFIVLLRFVVLLLLRLGSGYCVLPEGVSVAAADIPVLLRLVLPLKEIMWYVSGFIGLGKRTLSKLGLYVVALSASWSVCV